jgi:biopolymer transport protein ExbD
MKIRSFQKKPPRIEMLPLIDVVFLLLVVFIYAMLAMAVHKGMAVNLPISSQTQPDQKQVVSITVEPDGDVFIDKAPVALEALTDTLRALTETSARSGVLLFADRTVSYQTLFGVLDRIRQAGVGQISLQAEPEGRP